jgi:hypothetical protein
MRFFTLASLSFLAILASAPKTRAATTSELLGDLAKLPPCVVRLTVERPEHWIQLTVMPDYLHNVGIA